MMHTLQHCPASASSFCSFTPPATWQMSLKHEHLERHARSVLSFQPSAQLKFSTLKGRRRHLRRRIEPHTPSGIVTHPRFESTSSLHAISKEGQSQVAEDRSKASSSSSWPGLHAVVVGAGPSGALMALLLARQGFQVDVYERNAWGASGWAKEHGGWNVALTSRAFQALEEVGLLADVEARGNQIKFQALLAGEGDKSRHLYRKMNFKLVSCSIPDMTEVLIKEGMARYPAQIRYHFGWGLEQLDVATRTATFIGVGGGSQQKGSLPAGTPGAKLVARCDVLVGADGLGSVTRRELEAQVSGFKVSMECRGTGKAVSLPIPENMVSPAGSTELPNPLLQPQFQFDDKSFLVWRRAPRQMGVMPNSRSRMGFNLQGVGLSGEDAAGVAAQIQESFPEVAHLFPPDSEACRQLATSRELRHCTLRTSQFHHDSVVLIGDAAHGCLNFIGQGTNLAMEDCLVLESLLARHLQAEKAKAGADQEAAKAAVVSALAEFTAVRKVDTDAAAQMSEDIPKANLVLATTQFNFMTLLSKFLPGVRPWQDSLNATLAPPRQVKLWREAESVGFKVFAGTVSGLTLLAIAKGALTVLPL